MKISYRGTWKLRNSDYYLDFPGSFVSLYPKHSSVRSCKSTASHLHKNNGTNICNNKTADSGQFNF